MKGLIITLLILVIALALGFYFVVSIRGLWHSTKRFGKEGARLLGAPAKAAERYPAREADAPTPAPFYPQRREQANEDLRRVRHEREQKRGARLERATKRWQEQDENAYARLNREEARAQYQQRKDAQ